MPKLLITRPLPDRVIAAARDIAEVTVRPETTPLSRDEMVDALANYDAVLPTLGDAFAADIFPDAPRCGLLANFGVGYNHIDVAAAKAAGIAVTNTPGAVTDATADIAMTLMLMTCRRAGEGERMSGRLPQGGVDCGRRCLGRLQLLHEADDVTDVSDSLALHELV